MGSVFSVSAVFVYLKSGGMIMFECETRPDGAVRI